MRKTYLIKHFICATDIKVLVDIDENKIKDYFDTSVLWNHSDNGYQGSTCITVEDKTQNYDIYVPYKIEPVIKT